MADSEILHGQVIPPEARNLNMPAGTPLGLGFLGAARFGAIRRVMNAYEQARLSQATAIQAEGEVASALVRKAVAVTQLKNLDVICGEEENRIVELAQVAKLRRKLERMELEDEIAEKEARRKKLAGSATPGSDNAGGVANDEFAAFMADLKRMPDVVKAVQTAKDQIIKDAGGEDRLSEAQKATCEMFDSMLQSFMSKKGGEAAL